MGGGGTELQSGKECGVGSVTPLVAPSGAEGFLELGEGNRQP